MATLDLQIIHNNDDATGTLNGVQFNAAQSAVRMDSSTAGDGSRWLSGFRFQNVTIPQGATIDVAYVTFNLISGSDDANVDMYAEDTDDAVDFTAANLISRTLTTATAGWVQANASSPAQSPSIVALIQEVVDRPGWTSGNDLCLIFIGRGDFNGQFRAVAHDGTPASSAALHIEYTAGGDALVRVINESMAVAEDTGRPRGLVRAVADSIAITEAVSRARDLVRVIAEAMAITEAATRARSLLRVVTEGMSVTEATIRARGLIRMVADSLAITEAAGRVRGLLRVVNESLGITEAVKGVLGKAIDGMGLLEGMFRGMFKGMK